MTNDNGSTGGGTAVTSLEREPILDVVSDATRVRELVAILGDVDQGLDELARDLEVGCALPIETAARLRLLQRRARTSPDGTSYLGRAV